MTGLQQLVYVAIPLQTRAVGRRLTSDEGAYHVELRLLEVLPQHKGVGEAFFNIMAPGFDRYIAISSTMSPRAIAAAVVKSIAFATFDPSSKPRQRNLATMPVRAIAVEQPMSQLVQDYLEEERRVELGKWHRMLGDASEAGACGQDFLRAYHDH
ncbi:hypothetical protein BZM27_06265 [Paraburkholderia steynii]|uniref:Uncharacterized protein n=1 Tax=Paraburkholderia steynii TaxID=1245441 RepID=A0A4R0XNX7_9BURK|nr:hypothetical protein BZM27_06265 [Paraburkholderia steynii]